MNLTKQQANYDCMLACIACVVQRPYEELWPTDFRQDIEQKNTCSGDNIDKAFELAGLKRDMDFWSAYVGNAAPMTVSSLLKGRRAMLQVPSLNNPPPAQHIVFWTGSELHDPSNKQIYRWMSQLGRIEYAWIFNERST